VAIVGAGPTAFYAAEHLFRQDDLVVEIDVFDRVPTPYGLVRYGVAPDHQKIKTVTGAFDKIATHPRFRFYGAVEIGKHLTVDDLRAHYHQIVYATGAQTDRRMGIPGEDLEGSHPATHFVAWCNGHPDYQDHRFDLSVERVAIVGAGNVAIDVARILSRTPAELAKTDIGGPALEALRASRVREIYLLGRRGPAQAAFTTPEVKELGGLEGTAVVIEPREVALDPLTRAALERAPDRATEKKIEILQSYAASSASDKPRTLVLRFFVSPVEIVGNDRGEVTAIKLVRNELCETSTGTLQPRATDQVETLPVGLVFRSVGYRGVPLPDVPFDDRRSVILNEKGRVLHPVSKQPVVGEYTGGWIKRGPSGVIGTDKPDAAETVACMLEDLARGVTLRPAAPDAAAAAALVRARQPECVSYDDWRHIDRLEVERGRSLGRPRVKLARYEEILDVLHRRRLGGVHPGVW
jgi:ferredoxin--NADP+ reductase